MEAFTARQQQRVDAPIERAWEFLTRAALVSEWFADATPLAANEPFRFDFGDGDFFSGRVDEWKPPRRLGLRWRFMDVGPTFRIDFELHPQVSGTLVTVTDTGASTPEEAEGLTAGWEDFLERLARRVSTGQPSRYRWSPCIGAAALTPKHATECRTMLADPGWWRQAFPTAIVSIEQVPSGLGVTMSDPEWNGHGTVVDVEVRPLDAQTYIGIVHAGWEEFPQASQVAERRRYAQGWAWALKRLEALAGIAETAPTAGAPR